MVYRSLKERLDAYYVEHPDHKPLSIDKLRDLFDDDRYPNLIGIKAKGAINSNNGPITSSQLLQMILRCSR